MWQSEPVRDSAPGTDGSVNEFVISFPKGRLDVELCVSSGQVFRWSKLQSGEWLGIDGDHWYAISIESDSKLRVISNVGCAEFESFFRLDWDADDVANQILARAPEMQPYLDAMPGLRLLRPAGGVEIFYSFLCTPNNNLTRITQMVRHLASYGPSIGEYAGTAITRFPGSEVIASIDPLDLRSHAFGYRGNTIPEIANQVLARGGDEWILSLRETPYDEAHAALCELKGIGPKLADCIALFSLHHTWAVPIDTHLWQAATRLYFPEYREKALTDVRYNEVGIFFREKFGPLTGWAHQYLFYDNMKHWRSRK